MGKKKKGKSKKHASVTDELLNPPSTLDLGLKLTMFDVYHQYLRKEMIAHRRRKVTMRDLERHLSRWVEWWRDRSGDSPLPVAIIRRRHLEVFREWLRENGQTPLSCNSHLGSIRQILLCAVRNELIASAPALESLEAKCVAAKVFPSDEQTDLLWDAAEKLQWPTHNQRGQELPYSPTTGWRAWLVMMRTYGFRTQELTRFGFDFRCLVWGEVFTKRLTPNPEGVAECEWGWFRFTPPKQESKKPDPLTNPLTRHARAALELLRPSEYQPTDSVFDWPLSSASFYEVWHRWMDLAGVRPREGGRVECYTPKHYRKAATTMHNLHRPGIGPYIVGHASDRSGTTSVVSDKHYNSSEAAVLDCLMTAPMPSRFDSFLLPELREAS